MKLMKELYKNREFPQPKDNESITEAIDRCNWEMYNLPNNEKMEKY